jgi:hypothetical protein
MPGIFLLAGMGVQIPAGSLVLSVNADGSQSMEITRQLVRLDLWPTWLEVGCVHTDQARIANEILQPDLPDAEKYSALTAELQAGLVAITAFAFAFDGFYDTVRHELGDHPDQATWRKNRTSRDAQVAETLRYRLKLGPTFSRDLRTVLRQLFGFRSRAVHPSSAFVDPNYRPQIDSGVHPHLVTFSGPHSVQCRALSLELLDRMLRRAASDTAMKDVDRGWMERGLAEVDRLSHQYRVPGDEQLAFDVGVPSTP